MEFSNLKVLNPYTDCLKVECVLQNNFVIWCTRPPMLEYGLISLLHVLRMLGRGYVYLLCPLLDFNISVRLHPFLTEIVKNRRYRDSDRY